MKIITRIIKELSRPDDQGQDWYAWAANQTAHVALGVIIAGLVAVAWGDIVWAFIGATAFAVGKEIIDDLYHEADIGDSLQDIIFQLFGAWLAIGIYTDNHELVYASVTFIIVALIGGIWPRAKRAWRNK